MAQFKQPPLSVFNEKSMGCPNYVRFRLSPEMVIAIGARVKEIGPVMTGKDVELTAHYQPPGELEPYERLLTDAAHGEATYFARQDGVEAAWKIVDPILNTVVPVKMYEPGTWGPQEAEALVRPEVCWHEPIPSETREVVSAAK